MSDPSEIINQAVAGDRHAKHDLFMSVYEDLRRLAAARMAGEPPGNTLSPTALVHESFLRLGTDIQWNNPAHVYRSAAVAMRRILVDAARRKRAAIHGGDLARQELPTDHPVSENRTIDLVDLGEALEQLQQINMDAATVVDLRYFARLKWVEIAQHLDVSVDKAKSLWSYSQAKLSCLLREPQ